MVLARMQLTYQGKRYQKSNSRNHENNVQDEVFMIVDRNAIVHPRTVAVTY